MNLTYITRESNFRKECCHSELTLFMEEVGSKVKGLMVRMGAVEADNSRLREQLEAVNRQNAVSAAHVLKLTDEKQELLESRQKWAQGRQ
jgi:hypothetical protein